MRLNVFAIAALAAGCAGMEPDDQGPPGKADDADGDPDSPAPIPGTGPDYTGAAWRLTNISSSPNTISHDAQIGFQGTTPVIAFAEPDPEALSDQDIHTATSDGLVWRDEPRTDGRAVQFAFPSVVGAGGSLWLAYSGPDGDNRGIFLAERVGSSWAAPILATAEADADPEAPPRQNSEPRLVAAAAGPTALYYSREGEPGTIADEVELRAHPVGGEPEVALVIDASLCFGLRAVGDADGAIHALVRCGGFLYVTDAGGSWTATPLDLGASSAPSSADIAVDAGGGVHIAWAGRTDRCGGPCPRIFYSRDLAAPVVVADGAEGEGYHPAIAADAEGRAVIAYHRHHDDTSDVYVTHSPDGISFVPPRALESGGQRQMSPTQLVFGPDGRPHLVFERFIADSEPLDVEIFHATTAR